MSKILSLKFNAKINPLEELNESFTLCKCYVQGIGKNRNFSYMSKENVEKFSNKLDYCPVVGHLIEKEDGAGYYMGGHDYFVDENWDFKTLTVPYGVVKADTYKFEIVEEYGKQVEYLTCEVILWTERYPELKEAIYSEDTYFSQSMEIDVLQYRPLEEDSNYTEILEWNYSALCLLGKSDDKEHPEYNTEPCFIESKVVPVVQYSYNQEDFNNKMSELKNELAFYFNKNKEKGGSHALDKEMIMAILTEFGLDLDKIDFEITETMSEDELREKLKAFTETTDEVEETGEEENGDNIEPETSEPEISEPETSEPETVTENAETEVFTKLKEFALTYNTIMGLLEEKIFDENTYGRVEDADGTYAYYHVWEEDNGRKNYRVKYVVKDSEVEITSEPEEIFIQWLTAEEVEKLEASRNVFADYEELKAFKENALAEIHKQEIDEVLAEFEELTENEEFITLKETAYEFEAENLRKECFAIRGKMFSTNFSFKKPEQKNNKIILEQKETEHSPYGGLFEYFKNK